LKTQPFIDRKTLRKCNGIVIRHGYSI